MSNIIFDFDGTIADTFDYFVHFIADEAKRSRLDEHELVTLRGLTLATAARRLGHGWWRLPGLYFAGRRWMGHFATDIEPFDDMPETIHQLRRGGHKLFIVSSNGVHNIEMFLEKQGITNDFVKIYGNVALRSKGHVLKTLLRHNRVGRSDTCYVGDEPRDIRAAHRAGLKSIAVSWGYSSAETLQNCNPDMLLEYPHQLVDLFVGMRRSAATMAA